ncbi:MAG: BMC domain-containing protein [Lachnospiraceae bacterium]|nr:BMC domain-containing protein [Lachnospiraceae bacterium]
MERYRKKAVGVFEVDNLVAGFVALDAAVKAADVVIQAVERNRLKSGACIKMRGDISSVNAAMEVAVDVASRLGTVTAKTIIAAPSEGTETALEMTVNK